MPLIIPPESPLGQELARWNVPKRLGGEGPNGHEDYPRMLYKAHRYSNGKVMCGHAAASVGQDNEAMAFDQSCHVTVNSPEEHERYERNGWSLTQADAIEAFEANEREIAAQAANAEYQVRRMSEGAQREFSDAQDAADFHTPDPDAPALSAPTYSKTEAEFVAEIEARVRAEMGTAKTAAEQPVETAKDRKNRLAREARAAKTKT